MQLKVTQAIIESIEGRPDADGATYALKTVIYTSSAKDAHFLLGRLMGVTHPEPADPPIIAEPLVSAPSAKLEVPADSPAMVVTAAIAEVPAPKRKPRAPAAQVEAPKPAPEPTPVAESPKPAPVVEAPKPAPVAEAPKPAPVAEAPKPAPEPVQAEAPKPAKSTLVLAPTSAAPSARMATHLPTLQKARTLRDIIEVLRTTVSIAPTVDAMVSACEELKEYVPLIGKIPNVRERVLRTLEIMGLVAAEDDDSEDEAS